ncbi:MAG TPA: peroxide stress protein YaaA, partial [Propionibacteriaceae bacterium]|nr:peroxide stress protein YaaA [Propionibacteriaceae bacterium]
GTTITDLLREDLTASPGDAVVVNLASVEYFAAVQPDRLDARVISPRFEDEDERGAWKVMSFSAKRARGEMAAWLVLNRVRHASALRRFDGAGYAYVKSRSTPDVPVFRRPRSARGVA